MTVRSGSRRVQWLRALMATAGMLPLIWAGSAHAADPRPSVDLSRSSVVVFEVSRPEQISNAEQFDGAPENWIQPLAPSSERYAAVYFPDASAGWVQVRDPSAPKDPPLVAPIGTVNQRGVAFTPHHRYRMIVALDKPSRLILPDNNYRVLAVHHRQLIDVTLVIHQLPMPTGSSRTVAGFAPLSLRTAQAAMVALSVDYPHATDRITRGSACLAGTPAYPCALDTTGAFRASWWTPGSHGQDTVGTAYNSKPQGDYMTGDYEVLQGSQFRAARLIAFGLQFDQ